MTTVAGRAALGQREPPLRLAWRGAIGTANFPSCAREERRHTCLRDEGATTAAAVDPPPMPTHAPGRRRARWEARGLGGPDLQAPGPPRARDGLASFGAAPSSSAACAPFSDYLAAPKPPPPCFLNSWGVMGTAPGVGGRGLEGGVGARTTSEGGRRRKTDELGTVGAAPNEACLPGGTRRGARNRPGRPGGRWLRTTTGVGPVVDDWQGTSVATSSDAYGRTDLPGAF